MFLWRKKQNYPKIILKYPPYLSHWFIQNEHDTTELQLGYADTVHPDQ